jgi:HD-GYP domain-containing protein (c-di-GMP phosphodiesterase class II)
MSALPPAPARARALPISLSIAAVVIVSMLVLGAILLAVGFRAAYQTSMSTAAKMATDSGTIITEKAFRMLEPIEATLRQLASEPLAELHTTDQRLERIRVLSDEVVVNPLINAIYVGYRDGDFMLVRLLARPEVRALFSPPENAQFVVQSVVSDVSGARRGEWIFFDSQRRLIERRPKAEYQFDPRTRPWFQASVKEEETVPSRPYIFFTTKQVGITLSRLSHNTKAVFGIDVALEDLSVTLNTLKGQSARQLALVHENGDVLAYPDMSRVLVKKGEGFDFHKLDTLGEPALQALGQLKAPQGEPVVYDIAGAEWVGMTLPFNVWPGERMQLLISAPADELLGGYAKKRLRLLLLLCGIVLLLLPLGWYAGANIGRRLDSLTARARRISRFDFARTNRAESRLREVNTLSRSLDNMGHTIETFLDISQNMAVEPNVERMLDHVLQGLVEVTRCTAGVVYLWDNNDKRLERASIAGDWAACARGVPPLLSTTAAPAAGVLTVQALDDGPDGAGGSGKAQYAELPIALYGRSGQLQGLLRLVFPADAQHAEPAFLTFAGRLSGMLAVSIETRNLIAAQKNLLDAIIRVMADAIDAKSPYTGGHCERVPELATALVDKMAGEASGPYAQFTMTEDQRYEFYLGAWLHDCGKVTSPEHIVDKATKLELIYNRIHEVRMRFEVLWRDAELAHVQRLNKGVDAVASGARLAAQQHKLREDFAFVAQCNIGGEFMADAAIARLRSIAEQTWMRHFDDRLGLSTDELRRLESAQGLHAPALPVLESLLSDLPQHAVPWGDRLPAVEKDNPKNRHGFDMVLPLHQQNMGELYNLSVRRGTLTDEDRFKINDHIVQTLVMLRSLPWPPHLARVPDIAANHHEKMDGKGYPRKLGADQLNVTDRVMALVDVFEALTAADRPYKAPKTLSESLRIMAFMCKDQHLDTELFRYFLHSGVWRSYAEKCLKPSQQDAVNVEAIEALLPATLAR